MKRSNGHDMRKTYSIYGKANLKKITEEQRTVICMEVEDVLDLLNYQTTLTIENIDGYYYLIASGKWIESLNAYDSAMIVAEAFYEIVPQDSMFIRGIVLKEKGLVLSINKENMLSIE